MPGLGPALMPALLKRRVDLINLLLDKGANPNWRGNREAALHVAVRSGCLDCVKALVVAGADVNAKTKDNKPSLHLAKLSGHTEIADYLVSRGVVVPTPGPIASKLNTADVENGRAAFGRYCDGCHSIASLGGTKSGPNLWNVVGRDKAALADASYSDALLDWEGEWTFEDLNVFLLEPMLTTPGVLMEMPGIPDETERTDLIAYLRTLSETPIPLP